MYKRLKYPLLMTVLISGCADKGQPGPEVATVPETKPVIGQTYQKPGAAIRFGHNYDGKTGLGETETVTLVFTEAYDAGTLTVSLDAEKGLNLAGANTRNFDLQNVGSHEHEIALGAAEEGRYHLRIFAEVLLPDGQIDRRVFGLVLEVGDPVSGAAVEKAETEKDFRGDELILMPAEETIKN